MKLFKQCKMKQYTEACLPTVTGTRWANTTHSHSLTTSRKVSAGLEGSLIPENWDFHLLSNSFISSFPSESLIHTEKERKVIRRMKCFTSISPEGNTATYSASSITLNTESRMSHTEYKKQSYLNNPPPRSSSCDSL